MEKLSINKRIFGLDLLRACAILLVVIAHGNNLLPESISTIISKFLSYDGVSIFFVLSGFLIGSILIKTLEKGHGQKKLLLNFWIRRWFRTVPNYFLILVILLVLNKIYSSDFSFNRSFPLNYFTFSQNLFFDHPWFFPEAWSLTIEEWFYFLIPLIIVSFMGIRQSAKNSILLTSLLILILITLFRYYRYSKIPDEILSSFTFEAWDLGFRKQVITRLDSLMYGIIGAYLQYYYLEYWLQYKRILFTVGLSIFFLSKYFINPRIGGLYFVVFSFSLNSFATLLLLPFLSELKTNAKGFIYNVITKISLYSYSMYLFNLSIVQFWIIYKINWDVITNQNMMLTCRYSLYWFLTILLSMLNYKYFEMPMINLRDNKTVKKLLKIN